MEKRYGGLARGGERLRGTWCDVQVNPVGKVLQLRAVSEGGEGGGGV